MDIDNLKTRYDYVETVLCALMSDHISLTRAVVDLVDALKIAATEPDQLEAHMLGFKQRWQIGADIDGQFDGPIMFHDEGPDPFSD